MTNSRRVISDAPLKQRVKAGQKLKRAGTAAVDVSSSVSRVQKVSSYQNRSSNKHQSMVVNQTNKKQKENSQLQGMEPTTYQAIKSMVSGKQPPAYPQPQVSGQKSRPKSSNPTSATVVRRNVMHMREESRQLNLQNNQQANGGHRA